MIFTPLSSQSSILTFATAPRQSTRPVTSLVWANTITPTRVEWLWPGYIPLRKTSILQGDPGEGKSQIMIDIAARVTRGTVMPDGSTSAAGSVMWITTEDDASDTLRPRLEAANADLDRVAIIESFNLHGDMPECNETRCDNDFGGVKGRFLHSTILLLLSDLHQLSSLFWVEVVLLPTVQLK